MPRRGTRRSWISSSRPPSGERVQPVHRRQAVRSLPPVGRIECKAYKACPVGARLQRGGPLHAPVGAQVQRGGPLHAPSGHLRDPRRPLRPPTARRSLRLRPSSPQKALRALWRPSCARPSALRGPSRRIPLGWPPAAVPFPPCGPLVVGLVAVSRRPYRWAYRWPPPAAHLSLPCSRPHGCGAGPSGPSLYTLLDV